ncbi:hypothetical protein SAY87_002741 [Trapa incisa]|uniref:CDC20/Fizzy WD40 domain-containing protein n=1 Tax=Trapa incisa TaxID=236973 RepID=A0AAN7PUV6_9MYRT|nr:hypothetical protein SAY87_002741 [Trapa incisa]
MCVFSSPQLQRIRSGGGGGRTRVLYVTSSALRHSALRCCLTIMKSSSGMRSSEDLDRFIPNRSSMDFDYARYLLNGGKVGGKQNNGIFSLSRDAYQKKLIETFNMSRGRILAFKRRSPIRVIDTFPGGTLSPEFKIRRREIPGQNPARVLDAPELLENYHTNLLDWSERSNVVAIGLTTTAYLWNASTLAISDMVCASGEHNYITSLSWAPDGRNLAVGLYNSEVQIWDVEAKKLLRTLRGCHRAGVGSLSWNHDMITTGGMDCKVVNNDVRMRQHIVGYYNGHRKQICGLKWSGSGRFLASGGYDNLLHIWDKRSMRRRPHSSYHHPSSSSYPWIHRFTDHSSTVRALAWSPYQSGLLASGGGSTDRAIKFWDTTTGSMLKSVDTGSQVSALQWNRHELELLSSHGSDNCKGLLLWKYPSMQKIAELGDDNASRVLHMAQSPDGRTVVAAGDENLQFWDVFGSPEEDSQEERQSRKASPKVPFSGFNITIR